VEKALHGDRVGEREVIDARLEPERTALLLFDFLEGHVNRDAESRLRFAPWSPTPRAFSPPRVKRA
jgi:hypothetical protein